MRHPAHKPFSNLTHQTNMKRNHLLFLAALLAISGLSSCGPQAWDDEILMDAPSREASQPSNFSGAVF